jgi:hypothetical protein
MKHPSRSRLSAPPAGARRFSKSPPPSTPAGARPDGPAERLRPGGRPGAGGYPALPLRPHRPPRPAALCRPQRTRPSGRPADPLPARIRRRQKRPRRRRQLLPPPGRRTPAARHRTRRHAGRRHAHRPARPRARSAVRERRKSSPPRRHRFRRKRARNADRVYRFLHHRRDHGHDQTSAHPARNAAEHHRRYPAADERLRAEYGQ